MAYTLCAKFPHGRVPRYIKEQKCEFHCQKQWQPKFHLKLRNTTPPPYLVNIPKEKTKIWMTMIMMRLVVAMISSRVSKRGKCGQESNRRNIPLHQIPYWTHFLGIHCTPGTTISHVGNDWNHVNILLSWNNVVLFYTFELSINCIMNHLHICDMALKIVH